MLGLNTGRGSPARGGSFLLCLVLFGAGAAASCSCMLIRKTWSSNAPQKNPRHFHQNGPRYLPRVNVGKPEAAGRDKDNIEEVKHMTGYSGTEKTRKKTTKSICPPNKASLCEKDISKQTNSQSQNKTLSALFN